MGMRGALGMIFLLGMLVMALLQPVSLVRVETGEGEEVICSRVSPGTPVSLTFTHSMYGGFVTEMYEVDDASTLVRRRFVTENAAAAEYYGTDGRVQKTEDGYEVIAGPFSTNDLVVRVTTRGDHHLTIGSETWHLPAMFGEPVQLHISSERAPRILVPDSCTPPSGDLHPEEEDA